MIDVVAALRTHLLSVTAVTDLVSTRIYGSKLPESEVANMPRRCIVLRGRGGFVQYRTHREVEPRIDIMSFGDGHADALSVDAVVCDALMAIRRTAAGSVLLYSVGYSSGPMELTDPETGWDYISRTATVKAGEQEIPT